MIFVAAVVLTVGAIAFTLLVRQKDVPEPEAASGYEHLEQRRARIYEQLRDLQFEFRVGKLSEADYQTTKQSLQTELAGVLAQLDKASGQAPPPAPAVKAVDRTKCPHCGAKFAQPMKFCGQCGKAIA
jgi:hypothetical protein